MGVTLHANLSRLVRQDLRRASCDMPRKLFMDPPGTVVLAVRLRKLCKMLVCKCQIAA